MIVAVQGRRRSPETSSAHRRDKIDLYDCAKGKKGADWKRISNRGCSCVK